jgi:hypothetical protein
MPLNRELGFVNQTITKQIVLQPERKIQKHKRFSCATNTPYNSQHPSIESWVPLPVNNITNSLTTRKKKAKT